MFNVLVDNDASLSSSLKNHMKTVSFFVILKKTAFNHFCLFGSFKIKSLSFRRRWRLSSLHILLAFHFLRKNCQEIQEKTFSPLSVYFSSSLFSATYKSGLLWPTLWSCTSLWRLITKTKACMHTLQVFIHQNLSISDRLFPPFPSELFHPSLLLLLMIHTWLMQPSRSHAISPAYHNFSKDKSSTFFFFAFGTLQAASAGSQRATFKAWAFLQCSSYKTLFIFEIRKKKSCQTNREMNNYCFLGGKEWSFQVLWNPLLHHCAAHGRHSTPIWLLH